MSLPITPTRSVSGGLNVYVDAENGSGAGIRGRRDTPFDTAEHAVAAAQAGDTVHLLAGNHVVGTYAQLLKHLVNWHIPTGAQLVKEDTLTTSTAVPGIFDDSSIGANSRIVCTISGEGSLSLSISEDVEGDGGNQAIYAVNITNASSNIKIDLGLIDAGISLDQGSGGAVFQSAGTVSCNSIGDYTLTGGTCYLHGYLWAITQSGGLLRASVDWCPQLTITGGTTNITSADCPTINISAGRLDGSFGVVGTFTHGGGDAFVDASVVNILTRTGSSGRGSYNISHYGDPALTGGSVNVNTSGTAKTWFNGGNVDSTAMPFFNFQAGFIRPSNIECSDNGTSDVYGSEVAVKFGSVNPLDIDLKNWTITCVRASHSCLRILAEADDSGSKIRVTGGKYAAGSSGNFFSNEGTHTAFLYDVVTTNKSSIGLTQAGSGSSILDLGL